MTRTISCLDYLTHFSVLLMSILNCRRKQAFAQTFASIEALICKRREFNKAEKIETFLPALLQRDSWRRADKGEVLRAMYRIRNKIAHGTPTTVELETLNTARRLVAGLIRAVVRWRRFQIRASDETTWERFLRDIFYAQRNGKDVTQVEIDLSEFLPDNLCPKEPDIDVSDVLDNI